MCFGVLMLLCRVTSALKKMMSPISMLYPGLTLVLAYFALTLWYWRRSRRSISYLLSPPCDSWLVGNTPSFLRPREACEADFKWTREYGTAFRYKGCFNEDVLFVSDPKAVQYILNKGGYNFPKSDENRARVLLQAGGGLFTSEGMEHARHRRVMDPSFSHSVLKELVPTFFELAQKTISSWKGMIQKDGENMATLDVLTLVTRTTMDAIGECAFDYKFNAIEGKEPKTALQKTYENYFVDTMYMPSNFSIAYLRMLAYLPRWLFRILTYLPRKDIRRLKAFRRTCTSVAKVLFDREMQAHLSGKPGGKDAMSLLIKSNNNEDPRRRLIEAEILQQISALLLAGHESTANIIGWTLYEIARHPDVQHKLRNEIRATRAKIASRGDTDFTIYDMDTMKYTIAIMKESLRYHPISAQLSRMAARDDVIPLVIPARTVSGGTVSSIPIHKGQQVQVGLAAYNRLKSIWGEDVHEWKPERFLNADAKDREFGIGVYGNLGTFGSGVHSCLGWRFALLEYQIVLMELVNSFEFSPLPNAELTTATAGILLSMVKGEEHRGKQVPLKVSIVSENAD